MISRSASKGCGYGLLLQLFVLVLIPRAEGNLQSWSVKQKTPYEPGPGGSSRSVPYLSPESGGGGGPAGGFGGSSSIPYHPPLEEDPTCTQLLYGPTTTADGDRDRIKETQRGQATLSILTCILKELRRNGEQQQGLGSWQGQGQGQGLGLQIPPPPLTFQSDFERELLPPGYNRLQVPVVVKAVGDTFPHPQNVSLHPVHVDFFLNIQEVLDFSENEHFLGFDVEIIAGWTDPRFREHGQASFPGGQGQGQTGDGGDDPNQVEVDVEDVYLSGEFLDKIWAPDFFFEQIASSTSPNVGVVPKTIVLNPGTGYVKFKTRSLLNLYCDFDFFYYPADSQECHFTLRSYSYTTKLVNISWFDVGIYLHRTYDYNFEYQVVSAERSEVPERIGRWTNLDEKHAVLEFVVKSRRKLSYHVVQTYVPSVLLGLVTWLCFLVPREQSEVRVGVAMTTLLTITAMFSSVRANAPVVSYVKSIDIWMFGCIFFIFTTLAGFLAIAWTQKREKMAQIQAAVAATNRIGPTPTFHAISGGYDSKDNPELHHSEFCPIHSQFKAETPSPPSLTHTTTLTNLPTLTHTHPRPRPHPHPGCDELGLSSNSNSNNGRSQGGRGGGVSCSGCGCGADNGLDHTLMLLLPACFLIFVLLYWLWLLPASGYYSWSLNEEHNRVD